MGKLKYPATDKELVAAGYEFKTNSDCSGPRFLTPKGKSIPMTTVGDRDGEVTYQPHFADCPDRKRF